MSSPPVETRVNLVEQALAELSREVALAIREGRRASAEAQQRSAELDHRFQELREAEERGPRRLLVVEVRSTLAPEDVKSLLRILGEVREYLPEAPKREVLGALASFHVEPGLVRSAERKGLLMLGLSSGLVEVLNRPGFEPRAS